MPLKLGSLTKVLLAVLVMVASPGALAQAYDSYLVTYGGSGKSVTIMLVDCGAKFDASASKPQQLTCTLTPATASNTCQPCTDAAKCGGGGGVCPFLNNSADQQPAMLLFGRSRYNPTCGYVYDPVLGRYVYKCW